MGACGVRGAPPGEPCGPAVAGVSILTPSLTPSAPAPASRIPRPDDNPRRATAASCGALPSPPPPPPPCGRALALALELHASICDTTRVQDRAVQHPHSRQYARHAPRSHRARCACRGARGTHCVYAVDHCSRVQSPVPRGVVISLRRLLRGWRWGESMWLLVVRGLPACGGAWACTPEAEATRVSSWAAGVGARPSLLVVRARLRAGRPVAALLLPPLGLAAVEAEPLPAAAAPGEGASAACGASGDGVRAAPRSPSSVRPSPSSSGSPCALRFCARAYALKLGKEAAAGLDDGLGRGVAIKAGGSTEASGAGRPPRSCT